jgi:hypothetical protein
MSEYQALAYEKLGLSGEGHEIGTACYLELPDEVFYSICARRLNNVRQALFDRALPRRSKLLHAQLPLKALRLHQRRDPSKAPQSFL